MKNEIELTEVFSKFYKHIIPTENKRIIFSGKYGTGKTYFLEKFFKKNIEDFCKIRIAPLRYSINSNVDIFEIIKLEVLFELFKIGELELDEDIEIGILDAIKWDINFNINNIIPYLLSLSSMIGIVNEDFTSKSALILKIYEFITKINKKIKNKNLKIANKENKLLDEFYKTYGNKPGVQIGGDFILSIINLSLEKISKKTVLIIDDLDRLEPNYMFRILNILSAYNDEMDSESIINFNKIILVFDKNNIENIFIHKYGLGVDFDGYIDKFFSNDIFNFTNDQW